MLEMQNVNVNEMVEDFKNEALKAHTKVIINDMAEIKKNTLAIAGHLSEVKEKEFYADDFKNFGEYAEQVFGLKKSKASQLASIGKKFVKLDKDGNYAGLTIDGNFTYSQLLEMRNVDDDELSEYSDDMTCKEIREKASGESEKNTPKVKSEYLKCLEDLEKIIKKLGKIDGDEKDKATKLAVALSKVVTEC